MENNQISWSILEYKEKNHSNDWYWTVGLITLVVIGFSFYQKNYMFAFLIAIGIGTLIYLTLRKPETIDISISEAGIKIKSELFSYRKLQCFWVEDEHEHQNERHLLIMTDRVYSPILAIPIGEVSPDTLRETLKLHLEEKELHENPSHKFLEMLGF